MNALNRVPSRNWGLFDEFDNLVNGFFPPVRNAAVTRNGTDERHLIPAMDIVETEKSYVVTTDLPGVNKENLKVNIKDNTLTIEAETSTRDVEKEDKAIKVERRSGKYYRTLRVGNAVNASQISAEYTDGVLTLTLPKAEESVSREIDISVH